MLNDMSVFQEMQRHHEEMHRLFHQKLPVLVWNNYQQDMLDAPMKPSWSTSLSNPNSGHSGSYMDRYQKGPANGFPPESHNGGGGGKGDKGFTLLPNKYPSHSTSNGELPNLSSPYSHHAVHPAFGDFNSNLWSQHEEFMGFSNTNNSNNHYKGGGYNTSNSKGNNKHGRLQPIPSDKYSESTRRFDNFSQNNTSIDQSDSDHEPYHPSRPSYAHQTQYGNSGDGHFIKINRDYDDMEGKKDGGMDSAGSSNTRDSGVSSLKSSKTIPSPPGHIPPYGIESRSKSNGPKMTSNKKKSPAPGHMQSHPMDSHLSRSWRSTPDVPDLAKNEIDLRKSNEIGSDFSRSHSGSGSSGFLHRKPVLARSNQRKTSTESLHNRLAALELQDYDDGTESELPYSSHKGKIPKPVSYHLSLSTNNIPSEDDMVKSPAPYSTSSLRRNPTNSKPAAKSYLKASRTRSRTPVGRGMKDADSITSIGESFTPKLPAKKPAVPKQRVYKGSFRESNNGKSTAMSTTEVFPSDLKPVDSPRHSLSLALNNLNSSEWETNLDGFRLLVRLSRHHPESLRNDLHNININGMRHLMNLRSQVCRAACLFFKELFLSQGKLIEQDVEKISEKLLEKASDTNKFIREDSGSAIETMVLHLTPAKIITCLDTYGLKHRNPIVRTNAAKMLTLLIRRLGSERILYEHPEKVLPMVMHFLQEGSLETRTHAKAAIAELISNKGFDSQLRRHVPPDVLRNVQKIIATIRTEVFTAHSVSSNSNDKSIPTATSTPTPE